MEGYFQKIMIIDDDAIDRFILKKIIKKVDQKVEIVEAKSGIEALEEITECSTAHDLLPDLIFLDINMVLLDGVEFLNLLKHHHGQFMRRTSIVLISAIPLQESRRKILSYENVVDFFLKPINESQLLKLKEKMRSTQAS